MSKIIHVVTILYFVYDSAQVVVIIVNLSDTSNKNRI